MKLLLIGINSKYIHPATSIYTLFTNYNYEKEYLEYTIKDDYRKIMNDINNRCFDMIGFSIYIWNASFFDKLITEVNHLYKNKIIVGGPEVYYNVKKYFDLGCTFIIKGEGEDALNSLALYKKGDIEITDVPNLYYKDNGVIKFTYQKDVDLEKLKLDFSLIKDFKNRICYIEASRGCFFKCTYCMASLEKNVRFVNITTLLQNIKYLLDNNAKTIKFLDRSFNVRKDVMMNILSFIKDNDNGISVFQFEVVLDILDLDAINLLKTMRKGMIRLEVGIQSLNELTLKAVQRRQDFEKLKNNLDLLKNTTIIHTDLIAGLPFEDYNSFINTFNQTFLLFSNELQLGFLKELKGTKISIEKDKHNYVFDSNPPYEIIENKYISKKELNEIRKCEEALDKFYNKNDFSRVNNYLFNELKINPFFFYNGLKSYYNDSFNKLQKDEIYKLFFDYALKYNTDKDYLLYLIKLDYLSSCNIKPKIFWENDITRKERALVYTKLSEEYSININTLYSSAYLDKYLLSYFVVIFNNTKLPIIKKISF